MLFRASDLFGQDRSYKKNGSEAYTEDGSKKGVDPGGDFGNVTPVLTIMNP